MKISLSPLSKIKPYERNPRRNADAVDAVAASLKEFGFQKPIVVDADGVIVCGQQRFDTDRGRANGPARAADGARPAVLRRDRPALGGLHGAEGDATTSKK
jgi:hypothetical protein